MACCRSRKTKHGRSFGEPGRAAEVGAEQIVALQAPRLSVRGRPGHPRPTNSRGAHNGGTDAQPDGGGLLRSARGAMSSWRVMSGHQRLCRRRAAVALSAGRPGRVRGERTSRRSLRPRRGPARPVRRRGRWRAVSWPGCRRCPRRGESCLGQRREDLCDVPGLRSAPPDHWIETV
jgi:hypothetical protein